MNDSTNKLVKLQTAMEAANVQLAAIGPTAAMRYLLEYAPHADERLCLLLVSARGARLVVPTLNAEDVAARTDLPQFNWLDAHGPGQALHDALAGLAVKNMAIDGTMRADFLLMLLAAVQPEQTRPIEPLLAPLRACKGAKEIEALARAAAQADRAMQAAIAACRPGVTESEVAWAAEEAFRKDGAEAVLFTLAGSGPNGARPHHHSGERVLQAGDAVVLDIAATLNGYHSDITRMVFLGDPPPEFLKAYDAVLAANIAGRAAVKPGVPAQNVDRATRRVLAEAGYGDYFIHRTGHGIGLDIHEPPWIMEGNEQLLAQGMTFSVEPGVYLPGQFGIRIEDIVAVTDTGCQTLTGFDHQLVIKKQG